MTTALLGLARDGALLAVALALPLVVAAILAGAVTALVGAVTQVRDVSLGFAPRLIALALAVALTAPVIGARAAAFATRALTAIEVVGRGG